MSAAPLTVAVLLVCYNRRETTLRALRALAAQGGAMRLEIVLFDDASTDGTAEAVLREFPAARIVRGDGSAFWNGGLHACWTAALDLPVDAYLWLNDDVALDPDALARLAAAFTEAEAAQGDRRFVIAGATRGEQGEISYAGFNRVHTPFALRFVKAPPTDRLQPVDTFNGNIVLVPKAVVDEIGVNDPTYLHNFGDMDYGLRAGRAGMRVLLAPGVLGMCAANHEKSARGFGSPALSLAQQWKVVNTHRGLPFKTWLRFTSQYSGIWFPLHFLLPYRHLVIPRWGARAG